MDEFLKDLKYGARQLWRSPGFTVAAVLALALGVGATTAIFTVLDAVVLRPLPYKEPHRLAILREVNYEKGLPHEPLSPVNFMDYRGLSQAFSDAAAWWRPDLTLTGEGQEPIRVHAVEASTNLFRVLGVGAARGAGFPEDGELFTRSPEVVISHRLWHARFAGDPSLVGRQIRLDNAGYTVLGVMPPGFHYPGETDLWLRLTWDLANHSRGAHFMEAVARLRDGVTIERAQAELDRLTKRLGAQHVATNGGWTARAVALHTEIVGFFRPALYVLLGAVSLLLVIACVNVAGILLARGTGREREVAVRAAIGATRGRLVRQLLTESVLLALAGAAGGVALAIAGVRLLVSAAPIPIPRLDEIVIDARVLWFTVALAAATAIVFGLLPALMLSRADLQQTLKEAGRGSGSAGARARARRLLVVGEVALAVMLLFGAGLLIRTIANLTSESPGFDPAPVLTASIQLRAGNARDWVKVPAFYAALLDRVRESPGVDAAGATNFLPLAPGWRIPFLVGGRPAPKSGEAPMAQYHTVTDGYFETLRAGIVAGRAFDAHDTAESEPVVMVNQTLARQHFPGESAVGQTIRSLTTNIGPLGRTLMKAREHRIVGVVADVKNQSLQRPTEPALYFSVGQFPFRSMFVTLRGGGDPARLTGALREALRAIDPAIPLSDVRPMTAVVGEAVSQPRMLTYLMSGFAALALLLAALGIYGVIAFAVSQRQQEISIRLALGATPATVLWMVLGQGLGLVSVGVALGAAGGLIFSRSLTTVLYGTRAADPRTLVVVIALVVGVAASACLIPARRASTVNPMAGLRNV